MMRADADYYQGATYSYPADSASLVRSPKAEMMKRRRGADDADQEHGIMKILA